MWEYNDLARAFDIDLFKRIYLDDSIEMHSLWRTPFLIDGDTAIPIEFSPTDIALFLNYKLSDGRSVDEILRAVEYRIQFKETFIEENLRNT